MKRKSLVGWLLAGCSVAFAAGARGVVMPLAERTSVIDGRIADGEYDEGVTIGPFSRLHPILKWHRWDSEYKGRRNWSRAALAARRGRKNLLSRGLTAHL